MLRNLEMTNTYAPLNNSFDLGKPRRVGREAQSVEFRADGRFAINGNRGKFLT